MLRFSRDLLDVLWNAVSTQQLGSHSSQVGVGPDGPVFYEPAIRTEHISKLGWIDPITGKSYESDELRYALPEDISKWKQGRDDHHIPLYLRLTSLGKGFFTLQHQNPSDLLDA